MIFRPRATKRKISASRGVSCSSSRGDGRASSGGRRTNSLYHLHVPWVIPQTFVDACIPYASKRYNSALVGIAAAHSVQSGFFTVAVLLIVL
jgi:hypothetical protein